MALRDRSGLGDPCGYAIDTRSSETPVWWLEQMQLGPYSGPSGGPFESWFATLVRESEEPPAGASALKALGRWLLLAASAAILAWMWAWVVVRGRRG